MMRKFIILIAFVVIAISAYAEEIKLTTIMPAQDQVRGKSGAIGTTYKDQTLTDNNLIVEGNVGVGTTTPQAKLDVNGSARVTGTMSAGGITLGSTPRTKWIGFRSGAFQFPANGQSYKQTFNLGYNIIFAYAALGSDQAGGNFGKLDITSVTWSGGSFTINFSYDYWAPKNSYVRWFAAVEEP